MMTQSSPKCQPKTNVIDRLFCPTSNQRYLMEPPVLMRPRCPACDGYMLVVEQLKLVQAWRHLLFTKKVA